MEWSQRRLRQPALSKTAHLNGCEYGRRNAFFFFQAEDGIRDYKVTGVQTCALPIWGAWWRPRRIRIVSTPTVTCSWISYDRRIIAAKRIRETTNIDSSRRMKSWTWTRFMRGLKPADRRRVRPPHK